MFTPIVSLYSIITGQGYYIVTIEEHTSIFGCICKYCLQDKYICKYVNM